MDINNKINSTIAFFSGDIFTTILFMIYGTNLTGSIDWIHPAFKVALALVVGIVGGFGGLLGKDIYEKIKEFFKTRTNK